MFFEVVFSCVAYGVKEKLVCSICFVGPPNNGTSQSVKNLP